MIFTHCPGSNMLMKAALLIFFVILGCEQKFDENYKVQYIEPDAESSISLATVTEDTPLAFTNQFFPFDSNGELVGEDNPSAQVEQVLHNIEAALQEADTELENLVRIHIYLSDDSLTDEILRQLGQILPENTQPAVTLVSGQSARPGVQVAMDAIAVAPGNSVSESRRVGLYRSGDIYSPANRSHAAVLPPGRKIFISGQAEKEDNSVSSTRGTMRSLFATLAYVGANGEDVVQVKAFINPIEDAEAVEEEISSFFRSGAAPPIVSVEWKHDSFPVEIELVASAPEDHSADNNERVSYYAPVWLTQAETFSRIVDVQSGGLLFTSGLYGTSGQNEEAQAREIFGTLTGVLKEANSGYDHLVKATYYPSTKEGSQGLRNVRTEFYNPDRPPAASLAEVRGSGRQGMGLTVDMISVVPD